MSERGFSEALLLSDADALISVAPTEIAAAGKDSKLVLHPDFPHLPNKASQFARSVMGTREALNVVDPKLEHPTHSCVAIWPYVVSTQDRSGSDADAAFKRVVRKVKRKMVQTRSEDGARRMVVVDTWVTDHLDRLALKAEDYIVGQVLSQHAGVNSVMFIRRSWDQDAQRHRYTYRLFAAAGDTKATGLEHALTSWEAKNVVPSRIVA